MKGNPHVNRWLRDKAMDRIDHALGRPVWPLRGSYRNHYATDANGSLAIDFGFSPHWEFIGGSGDMAYFGVTHAGRQALCEHLSVIGEPHRAFAVTYEGFTTIVAAPSRAAARYREFLAISDCCCDLTFGEFMRASIVRAAA